MGMCADTADACFDCRRWYDHQAVLEEQVRLGKPSLSDRSRMLPPGVGRQNRADRRRAARARGI